MSSTKFNVFITKYALSRGIEEKEVEDCFNINPTMVSSGGNNYYKGGEWFITRQYAIADAEKRRLKKISSLQKQIAKLEKMKFE